MGALAGAGAYAEVVGLVPQGDNRDHSVLL